ncbi:ankyrin repeat protein [Legionella santicrucis]|uniref:Ankyrin repeat protein n=1 Tax=Legionella santicrucis TaxID=45074 RepID=A0A0W0YAR6_9GAMM|nr:ankyrin repeat domain-containing protein [Legionella santicrucis]KTD53826.1 ankyrin repeat protein [Legionella santicrucis]
MKFHTHANRENHPLASLIPQNIWFEFFKNNEIPDSILDLMGSTDDEIKNAAIANELKTRETWIAIAVSHPALSTKELIEIGKKLNLDESSQLNLTVMLEEGPRTRELLKTLSEKEFYSHSLSESYFLRIQRAAKLGHIHTLKFLAKDMTAKASVEKINIDWGAIIARDDYEMFYRAAERGFLEVLKYLESLAPEKITDMIKASNFYAFEFAACFGHLHVLQYLHQKEPDILRKALPRADFITFIRAIIGRHLNILQFFEEHVSRELFQEMIKANNFRGFRYAAKFGSVDILKYLEEKAPQELQNMIAADNFNAFFAAVEQGHLPVLEYLKQKTSNEHWNRITNLLYGCFTGEIRANKNEIRRYLLAHANAHSFDYIEAHEEYRVDYVEPFVTEKMTALYTKRLEAQAQNPNAVFDVEPQEAQLLFYIARNLIRRNEFLLIEHLRFLLCIPAVKALAHAGPYIWRTNELLRLAQSVGNAAAANLLLTIPEVRTLAEQNNYYLDEQQGRLNLAELAANHESSLIVLTQGEQQRLQAAINRYQPLLKQGGVNQIMNELRTKLEALYQENPARLTIQEESLQLPLTWNAFQQLQLTSEQEQRALTAYYQNKAHTAWRYLSKPNPWMHHQASYVNINQAQTARWSTFEKYQTLISILYLATIDENTPCIDGFTLITRLQHFIDELAHIGRAHNWDKSRLNHQGIKEQYDDLEGDRPSCFSGVKRRLFQAVLGHPLLKLLTKDIIKTEINEFLRAHFEKTITNSNIVAVKQAWDKNIEEGDLNEDEIKHIQSLNVSSEQQQEFTRYLSNKYGPSFASDHELMRQVDDAFSLSTSSSHLFKHGGIMVEFFNQLTEDVSDSNLPHSSEPEVLHLNPAPSNSICVTEQHALDKTVQVPLHSSNEVPTKESSLEENTKKEFERSEKLQELQREMEIAEATDILEKSNFMTHLKIIQEKTKEFEQYALKNPQKYKNAAKAARELYQALEHARLDFVNKPEAIQKKLDDFKKTTGEAISHARPVLKEHRGWKQVLADIASAIITLATGFSTYFVTNRFRLFQVQTDAEKKLLDLEKNIQSITTHDK